MRPYVETVICEDCWFAENLKNPTTSLGGWAAQFRMTPDGLEQGDICPICFAKSKTKND